MRVVQTHGLCMPASDSQSHLLVSLSYGLGFIYRLSAMPTHCHATHAAVLVMCTDWSGTIALERPSATQYKLTHQNCIVLIFVYHWFIASQTLKPSYPLSGNLPQVSQVSSLKRAIGSSYWLQPLSALHRLTTECHPRSVMQNVGPHTAGFH